SLKVLAVVSVLCIFVEPLWAIEATKTNSPATAVTNAPVTKVESNKHKLLKLLFDGVPDEGATNLLKAPRQKAAPDRRPSVLSAFPFGQGSLSNLVFHPPFAKQECAQCHGGSLQNPVLKAPQQEL